MPAFDSHLMFRNTNTTLTASVSSANLTIRKTGFRGMTARVVVPSVPNTVTWGGLRPEYYGSDDGTVWSLIARYQGVVTLTRNGSVLMTPIVTNKKYIYEFLYVLGTWTYGYGNVVSGLVQGVGFDWTRARDFS